MKPKQAACLTVLSLFLSCPAYSAEPTKRSAVEPLLVRVLVAEGQKNTRLSTKGNYQVRILPGLQVVKKGRQLNATAVVTPRGVRLGSDEWTGAGILVETVAEKDLWLNQSQFRGTLSILKDTSGGLFVVNRLPIEAYLYGVLHHEVAPWWPMEALEAQAIAARTYAIYQRKVSKNAQYDLKSNTSSQVYGGSSTERYRTKKAVDNTAGQILTHQGKVFPAYFHATCAGETAGAQEIWKIDLPPISGGVKCRFCVLSPHFHWQARVPLSELEQTMTANGRGVGQILKIEAVSQTPSHRVGSVRITGNLREETIAAKDLRIWIGGNRLKSTTFTVFVQDDAAEFRGKGWGHGVGLCQWGTFGQSLLGHKHEDILSFYYPGSAISKISELS